MDVGSLRLARSPQAHACRSNVGAKRANTSETRASSEARWLTIVGVAARTRYRELTATRPTLYLLPAQFCDSAERLAIRTSIRPESVASAIRGQLESPPGSTKVRAARRSFLSSDKYCSRYRSAVLARGAVDSGGSKVRSRGVGRAQL
jgi:hypothetical protein